jgi:hypothetical protein
MLVAFALVARGSHTWLVDLPTPRNLHEREYVGSGACQRCHPDHHASWARTFHRTMTQSASDESVLGAFDGRTLSYGGFEATMFREDEDFVISLTSNGRELERARIDRTVGSRRYQQYLVRRDDSWWRLPVAWDVEEARFFHMNAAFLTPDPAGFGDQAIARTDFERHVTRWNDNCVFCHNVSPNPGLDSRSERFDTEVAELGIGCEACHGPGSEHVTRNADPVRRYLLHFEGDDGSGDPTIISPRRLSPERRADVCGRCHGQRITDDVSAFLVHGDPFVPGDDLAMYSSPLWHDTSLGEHERAFEARFWGDGTARLTAYEYQGLLQSRCASEGALTCTDCHGMHDGDPRGQLRPALADGDSMCAGACHSDLASARAAREHTGHDDVRCVDCHMPRIVFGVRDVHRSHRIDVPRPMANARAGRTDACTLCHLDEGPAWAEQIVARRAKRLPEAGEDAEPVLIQNGFGGDPIQRAIVMAAPLHAPDRDRARRIGVLLTAMREDDYPAIRHLAWRTLRQIARVELPPTLFSATDPAPMRVRNIETIRAELGEPVDLPDPNQVAALRARAREIAIEIGE